MGIVEDIKSLEEFENNINNSENVVVHFWATWSEPSKYMDSIFVELSNIYNKSIKFLKVEAEVVSDISEKYNITSVPTFLLFKESKIIEKIEGANPPELTSQVENLGNKKITQTLKLTLNERIEELIKDNPIMLFMKGTPDMPKCGFSKKVVEILKINKIDKYSHFNILEDEEIRQGLKEYSNWPTYPQLYVCGEFIGGCDIIIEMQESGELIELIKNKLAEELKSKKEENFKYIKNLIIKEKIMLFMKGSPDMPKCGFSAKVVNMLDQSNIKYGYFDILEDNSVREGLKEYSDWPTFPQLYVNSNLVGGCDIITELFNSNELISTIEEMLNT